MKTNPDDIITAIQADKPRLAQFILKRIDLVYVAEEAMHEMIDLDKDAIEDEMVRLAVKRTKARQQDVRQLVDCYVGICRHFMDSLKILYGDTQRRLLP